MTASSNEQGGRSPQTLDLGDRRALAAWAHDCVTQVLSIYPADAPDAPLVTAALDRVRAFAAGDLDVGEAVRARGAQAGAAARSAPTPAARAVAYAAEQAAAVAHMGAHALGAAGYAGKASLLDASRTADDAEAVDAVAGRQLALLDDGRTAALARLPLLGENPSGPLGPGRLSMGMVGAIIRAVQGGTPHRLS